MFLTVSEVRIELVTIQSTIHTRIYHMGPSMSRALAYIYHRGVSVYRSR